jgi:HK97 gp10 family phage protein
MPKNSGVTFDPKVAAKFTKQGQQALIRGGLRVEAEAKKSMRAGSFTSAIGTGKRATLRGKSGKRGRRRVLHFPSNPGRPPAPDSGRLRASVSTNWTGNSRSARVDAKATMRDGMRQPRAMGRFFVVVGTNVDYGRFTELGTRRMKPRPWLRPAFRRNRNRIMKEFSKTGFTMGIV